MKGGTQVMWERIHACRTGRRKVRAHPHWVPREKKMITINMSIFHDFWRELRSSVETARLDQEVCFPQSATLNGVGMACRGRESFWSEYFKLFVFSSRRAFLPNSKIVFFWGSGALQAHKPRRGTYAEQLTPDLAPTRSGPPYGVFSLWWPVDFLRGFDIDFGAFSVEISVSSCTFIK